MARIRTIKPSFFTNEVLAELSPLHRLCFIGLWTQADREGRIEDRPKRLKAALFPYEDVSMADLIDGLAAKGFVTRYEVGGSSYLAVVGFLKHQRPKKDEQDSTIPPPVDPLGIGAGPRGIVTPPRIGKGIGNGEEGKGMEEGSAADVAADCHLFGVAWNELTSSPIAKVQQVTSKRKRHIRARLEERPLTEWRLVFARIEASSFCRGQNDRQWIASFDWVIGSPDVGVKVLEGKYDNRKTATTAVVPHEPHGIAAWVYECAERHGSSCKNSQEHAALMAAAEVKVG